VTSRYHAHRPESRARWYARLLVEVLFLGAAIVAVVLTAGLVGSVPS